MMVDVQIIIVDTPEAVGRAAASRIARVVRDRPDAVLGLATGSSPLGTYAELARAVERGDLDCSAASAFALDEYVGLPAGHPESYRSVIDREAVRPLGMRGDRVHVPDGSTDDVVAACEAYERLIAEVGPVDVQLLGIGANGHVGFNEPTSSFGSRTRIKTLTTATREANARFFESLDDVPHHCITQGLGTILDARELLLVAFGAAKAEAVAAAVEGPLTSLCPASALQLHPSASVVVDEAAAAALRLGDYYREVQGSLPPWQRARWEGLGDHAESAGAASRLPDRFSAPAPRRGPHASPPCAPCP